MAIATTTGQTFLLDSVPNDNNAFPMSTTDSTVDMDDCESGGSHQTPTILHSIAALVNAQRMLGIMGEQRSNRGDGLKSMTEWASLDTILYQRVTHAESHCRSLSSLSL